MRVCMRVCLRACMRVFFYMYVLVDVCARAFACVRVRVRVYVVSMRVTYSTYGCPWLDYLLLTQATSMPFLHPVDAGHGTCDAKTGCVCDPGWAGVFCNNGASEPSSFLNGGAIAPQQG